MRGGRTMQQTPPDPCGADRREVAANLYVVDDDLAVARTVSRAAGTIGFRTEIFGSASEFLERLGELEAGCILLDIRMPGMNGLELLDR